MTPRTNMTIEGTFKIRANYEEPPALKASVFLPDTGGVEKTIQYTGHGAEHAGNGSDAIPAATSSVRGTVRVDGTSISVDGAGILSAIGAAPTGSASGELAGSYPGPTLARAITPTWTGLHTFSTSGTAVTRSDVAGHKIGTYGRILENNTTVAGLMGSGSISTVYNAVYDATDTRWELLSTAHTARAGMFGWYNGGLNFLTATGAAAGDALTFASKFSVDVTGNLVAAGTLQGSNISSTFVGNSGTAALLGAANVFTAAQAITPATGNASLSVSSPDAYTSLVLSSVSGSGGARDLIFATLGSLRWNMRVNATTESGGTSGRVGSDLNLITYDNAGANAQTALTISRSTLAATFGGIVSASNIDVGFTGGAGTAALLGAANAFTDANTAIKTVAGAYYGLTVYNPNPGTTGTNNAGYGGIVIESNNLGTLEAGGIFSVPGNFTVALHRSAFQVYTGLQTHLDLRQDTSGGDVRFIIGGAARATFSTTAATFTGIVSGSNINSGFTGGAGTAALLGTAQTFGASNTFSKSDTAGHTGISVVNTDLASITAFAEIQVNHGTALGYMRAFNTTYTSSAFLTDSVEFGTATTGASKVRLRNAKSGGSASLAVQTVDILTATSTGVAVTGTLTTTGAIVGSNIVSGFSGGAGTAALLGTANVFTASQEIRGWVTSKSSTTNKFRSEAYHTTASISPTLDLFRSHNVTLDAYTATADGDFLGQVRFLGVDASGVESAGALIRAMQVGAAGTNQIGADLILYASTGAANVAERMRILGAGGVSVTGALTVSGAVVGSNILSGFSGGNGTAALLGAANVFTASSLALRPAGADASLIVDTDTSGFDASIFFQRATSHRWRIFRPSGNDNLIFRSQTGATSNGDALTLNNATLAATFGGAVTATGAIVGSNILSGFSGGNGTAALLGTAQTFTAMQSYVLSDAATSTRTTIETLGHNSSATPSVNFGIDVLYNLKSSTTNDRNAARVGVFWTSPTDATRTSAYTIETVDTAGALTERLRVSSAGLNVAGSILATSANRSLAGDYSGTLSSGLTQLALISNTGGYTVSGGAAAGFGGIPGSSSGEVLYGAIGGYKSNTTDGDTGGYLALFTNQSTLGLVERMRVTSTGALVLGIEGSTTPATLTLRGAQYDGANVTGSNLQLDAPGGTGTGGSGDLILRTAAGSSADVATIGFGTVSTANTGTGLVSTLTWAHTVDAGPQRILVVTVSVRGAVTISGITYGGIPLTFLQRQLINVSAATAEIWYLLNPPVGTANLIITESGTARFAAAAANYTNVNQVTPFGTPVTATGTTTSATVNVTGVAAGEVVIDALSKRDSTEIPTADFGQGVRAQYVAGVTASDIYSPGGTSFKIGTGTINMLWTWSTTARNWAMVAVAMKPGSAPNAMVERMRVAASGAVSTTGPLSAAGVITASAGIKRAVTTISSAGSTTAGHSIVLLDSTGGAFTLTLLSAATYGAGRELILKRKEGGANAVTVDAAGSETIDGALTVSLGAWTKVTLLSDGTNWLIIS
jgi:hypothetical protein